MQAQVLPAFAQPRGYPKKGLLRRAFQVEWKSLTQKNGAKVFINHAHNEIAENGSPMEPSNVIISLSSRINWE